MGPRGRFYPYLYHCDYIGLLGTSFMKVFYLGRAPRTNETLPDFLKWRRVTRHPLVFRGLTGSQRTLGFGASQPAPMSTSPLKRMELRIKGWFKCILGKQKQLDHRLSRLESHIYRGEPALGDAPPLNLEGDSEELDDCVDEDAFSLTVDV